MSIKITLEQLVNGNFRQAITKINVHEEWPDQQTSYKVSKLIDEVNKNWKSLNKEHETLFKQHCKKDDKGELIKAKPGANPGAAWCPYEIAEGKEEELKKKIEELMKKEVSLSRGPLTFEMLAKVKLSPAHYLALGDFIQEDPSS